MSNRIITATATPVRILGRPPVSRPSTRPTPRLLADGSYMVDSATATLVAYHVRNQEHGWACDCPAGAFYRTCWHLTAVLAVEAAQQDVAWLTDDLEAITEHIRGDGGDDAPLYYKDGTPKNYTAKDVKAGTFVAKAQATWSWTDGKVA